MPGRQHVLDLHLCASSDGLHTARLLVAVLDSAHEGLLELVGRWVIDGQPHALCAVVAVEVDWAVLVQPNLIRAQRLTNRGRSVGRVRQVDSVFETATLWPGHAAMSGGPDSAEDQERGDARHGGARSRTL